MANITDFYGEVEIFAKDTETVVTVTNILFDVARASYGDYGFYPHESGHITVKEVGKTDDWELYGDRELPFSYVAGVDGSGRWSFCNNIESYGAWLDEDLTAQKKDKEREILEGLDFTIRFCGSDMDSAMGTLNSIDGCSEHIKDTPIDGMDGHAESSPMTYSIENVMSVFDIDRDSALELMGLDYEEEEEKEEDEYEAVS